MKMARGWMLVELKNNVTPMIMHQSRHSSVAMQEIVLDVERPCPCPENESNDDRIPSYGGKAYVQHHEQP